jgi:hypothetical protein
MIRVICKAAYVGPDGPIGADFKTFDLDAPDVEQWLKACAGLEARSVVGVEVLKNGEEKR